MLRKVALTLVALVLVTAAVLFFWARSILSSETVRSGVAAQISRTLGQPVSIGTIRATIFPRVTMTLGDVRIGEPARITIQDLHVGTALRALLSRRIENADVQLDGARIELPLPSFAIGSSGPGAEAGGAGVEIVSVDEVVLRNVEIVSGGRTLRGDIEVVPHGQGLTIRRVTLSAGDTAIDVTGEIANVNGPAGTLAIKAGTLDVLELLAFASDFSKELPGASAPPAMPTADAASAADLQMTVSIDAERALLGTLALTSFSGHARVGPETVTIDPIGFGLFDGRYDGTLALTLGDTPDFRLQARLANVDVAAATAFAGQPDTITGRLNGTIDLAGRGTDAGSVLTTSQGTARVEVAQGTVKGLGLVRNVVLATSMRADAAAQTRSTAEREPFSRMGGTLAIARGTARTDDFRFESNDLLLSAAGSMQLDGSAVNLDGRVQLSDELSQQAGRDLLRYTAQGGRVTLPATVSGPIGNLQVRIDMAAAAKRAIVNRATEEAGEAIKKGLSGLFGR